MASLPGCRERGPPPLILKLNNSDSLADVEPCSAVTASVDDALRLGCSAIGYTIYPGSAQRNVMFEDLRELTFEAKAKGLAVVVWAYPRGSGISKEGETAVDLLKSLHHLTLNHSYLQEIKKPVPSA